MEEWVLDTFGEDARRVHIKRHQVGDDDLPFGAVRVCGARDSNPMSDGVGLVNVFLPIQVGVQE